MAIESENVSNQVCSAKKQGRQNILLLFLSYIKVGNTGKVESHDYKEVGKAFSTNESAVRYLHKKAGSVDKVFIIYEERCWLCQGEYSVGEHEGNFAGIWLFQE